MSRKIHLKIVSVLMVLAMLSGSLIISGMSFTASAASYDSIEYLAYYPFLTDANEASGNAGAATPGGTVNFNNGYMYLPGGSSSSSNFVTLPTGLFDGQDEVTISVWLKNETGSGNYAAMSFGAKKTGTYPPHYWLMNPANPAGLMKSVFTNTADSSAPWGTEYGISPTNSPQGVAGPTTDSDWHLYTTVITADSITAYYDDTGYGPVDLARSVSSFGSNLIAYIGKSEYPDKLYQGGVKELKIFKGALTSEQVEELYLNDSGADVLQAAVDALSIPLSTAEDITLPSTGKFGSTITWSSSDTSIMTDDGKVMQYPATSNETLSVTMTATVEYEGETITKEFIVEIIDPLQGVLNNVSLPAVTGEDLDLPSSGAGGVAITWSSSDTNIMTDDGKIVSRPSVGEGNKAVTMTATITNDSGKEVTKDFQLEILEEYYGYILSYTRGTGNTESSLHLAHSTDGKNFEALNSNLGILYLSGKALSSPNLFRKTDGTFGLTTSLGTGSTSLAFFDTEDFITYTNERYIETNTPASINPRCVYNSHDSEYNVYWSSNNTVYSAASKDLKTISSPIASSYEAYDFTGMSFPKNSVPGNIIPVTKSEYDRVVKKFTRLTNTGVSELPENIETESINTLRDDLPTEVTATYSDGTTNPLPIEWDIRDYMLSEAGTYTINGTISEREFENPFIEQRADPYICYDEVNELYYFTASYPAYYNGNNGYDRIILRAAETVEGLADAEEVVLWHATESTSVNSAGTTLNTTPYIWAPEIHNVDGKWYVFYASGTSTTGPWPRCYTLVCIDNENPSDPASWVREDGTAWVEKNTSVQSRYFSQMSLDMTYFEQNGKHYVCWADFPDGPSSLYLQEVDPAQPWKGISDKVLRISQPEYSWESIAHVVNEGATVLKNNGKIFLAFSGSGTGPEYSIGLLYADEDADLLDMDSWTKLSYPILTSDHVPGEYGPGHNSFVYDQQRQEWLFVYHARSEECYLNNCQWGSSDSLYDPCRHARVRRVHWDEDGFPILNTEERSEENSSVQIQVTIKNSTAIADLPDPVLEYNFDEELTEGTALDTAGNNNATLVGGATYVQDTEGMGQVLSLDGKTNTHLAFPRGFFDGRDEMTFSMDVQSVTRRGNYFVFAYGQNSTKYLFLKMEPQYMRVSQTANGYSSEQTASATLTNKNNSRRWVHITIVMNNGSIELYQDGILIGSKTDATVKTSDLGENLYGYLGKSFYSADKYFKGFFDNVKVYDSAFTSSDVFREYDEGVMAREELNRSLQKVADEFTIANSDNVKDHLNLPNEINGIDITWQSSDESIVYPLATKDGDTVTPAGVVTRPAKDTIVTLTGTFSNGESTIVKTYDVTVIAKPDELADDDYVAYLFTHFIGSEANANQEQVYFSTSLDGMNWTTLNNGNPVLKSTLGEEGLRDHYILRAPEGDKFYMIATDLSIYYGNRVWMEAGANGSRGIVVWESDDLVNWSEPRLSILAPEGSGCTWAPEIIYDELTKEYVVYWSATTLEVNSAGKVTQEYENHRVYYAKTRDFRTFTEAKVFNEGGTDLSGKIIKVIDSTMIKDGDTYYRYTKNESTGKIFVDKSDKVLGDYTAIESNSLNTLDKTHGAVEGPIIFKMNKKDSDGEDKWCLMVDRYGQGKGYLPLVTNDLASGEFEVVPSGDFSLPSSVVRHGYVIPITGKEYKALQEKWGTAVALETTELEDLIAEAKEYNAADYTETSYANLQDAIKAAEKVLENALTQDEIDAAVSSLQAAIDALEETNVGELVTIGDVNEDGKISLIDVLTIQKAVAYIITLTDKQEFIADVDQNGSVTLADALLIQKYITKLLPDNTYIGSEQLYK